MRSWIAAAVGGVAGAAAALGVVSLRPDAPTPAPPDSSAVAHELAALAQRLDRLERRLPAARDHGDEPPSASNPFDTPSDALHVGDFTGNREPRTAENVDLTKVTSEDLALEADDRHTHDFDVSGAAKRYRELLSRAGTPADRRHWNIRLGDCYVRLHMQEEAMRAYRDCVDASTEDHAERVACMISLARHTQTTDPAESLRWIERALELESGRSNSTVHYVAYQLAGQRRDAVTEADERRWLTEHGIDVPEKR